MVVNWPMCYDGVEASIETTAQISPTPFPLFSAGGNIKRQSDTPGNVLIKLQTLKKCLSKRKTQCLHHVGETAAMTASIHQHKWAVCAAGRLGCLLLLALCLSAQLLCAHAQTTTATAVPPSFAVQPLYGTPSSVWCCSRRWQCI